MNSTIKLLSLLILLSLSNIIKGQILDHSWKHLVRYSNDKWFKTDEAKQIAENVLLYQRDIGGWPKNIQMHRPLSDKQKKKLQKIKSNPYECTTDNGATTLEMHFLSRMYKQVTDDKYKEAFLKGLKYMLKAQYDNGGWPQFYPLKEGYYTHITYNDNSMTNIMNILENLFQKTGKLSITPSDELLKQCEQAFNKGIACILKTQYVQDGELTLWCAQHNEKTFLPAKARAYELPSLSGQESAGIVLLLMTLDNPSQEIKNAINGAVKWYEKTKIKGIRIERYKNGKGKGEKRIIKDVNAPALWARFMELDDNTPFFCDRDGVKRSSLMDIGRERRNGYKWYSQAPQMVLDQYPEWKKKWDSK